MGRYSWSQAAISLAGAVGLAAVLAGCGAKTTAARPLPPSPVDVETVKLSPLPNGEVFYGTVTPFLTTTVSPAISGTLASVAVRPGDRVLAGQVLGTLDTQSLQDQLAQDQANMGVARAQVTAQEQAGANALKQAEAALASAEAGLESAKVSGANSVTQQQQALALAQSQEQNALAGYQAAVAAAQQQVAVAQAQLASAQAGQGTSVAQAQAAVDAAQANLAAAEKSQQATIAADQEALAAAQLAVSNAQAALNQAEQTSFSPTAPAIITAKAQLAQAEQAEAAAAGKLKDDEASPAVTADQAALKQAQANLQAAESGESVQVAQAQLKAAQTALANAQSTDSLQVAKAQVAQAEAALKAARASAQVSLNAAEAQLAQAQTGASVAASNPALGPAQAQVRADKAAVQTVLDQIHDGTITAPISGVVTAVNAEVGQGVGPTTGFVTIETTAPAMAVVNVPEYAITGVRPGTTLSLAVPTLKKTVAGTVFKVNPALQAQSDTYPVYVLVNHPPTGWLPGLEVEASLSGKSQPAIMVPADAVLSLPGGALEVFLDKNGVAQSQIVQVGVMTPTEYQITSGLKVGELLVVQGQNLLSPGQRLRVLNLPGGAKTGGAGKKTAFGGAAKA